MPGVSGALQRGLRGASPCCGGLALWGFSSGRDGAGATADSPEKMSQMDFSKHTWSGHHSEWNEWNAKAATFTHFLASGSHFATPVRCNHLLNAGCNCLWRFLEQCVKWCFVLNLYKFFIPKLSLFLPPFVASISQAGSGRQGGRASWLGPKCTSHRVSTQFL